MSVAWYTPVSEIAAVVSRCRRAYQNRILFPLAKRQRMLQQLASLVKDNDARLKAALHSDLHKSGFESTVMELGMILNECYDAIGHLEGWMQPEAVKKDLAMIMEDCTIQRDPLGVVLIIGAWNYPVQLTLVPLVGALAAGNSVVIKPSEVSAETAKLLTELIARYFDPSEVAVVNGGVPETTELLNQRFDHILYTGNSRVARIVMTAAAKFLTPVTLELGGKSPCIVDEVSDMAVVARRIAWGRLVNAGQTCIAPDYILVRSTVKPQLIEELKKAFTAFLGSNPKESPDYPRIVNAMHFKRVTALLRGGRVVFGGETDEKTRYIAPTILDDVDLNSPLMTDEIFGPLLPIIPYETPQEAIDFINVREKPLALYVFAKDSDFVRKVQLLTSSGGLTVNDTLMHASVATLPFGGVGESGMGAYHGRLSFDTFSHKKAVLKRALAMEGLNDMRYPPYSDSKLKRLRLLGLLKSRPPRTWCGALTVAIVLVVAAAVATVTAVFVVKK